MKKFFLVENSYSFYSIEESFLGALVNGKIINLSEKSELEDIQVENMDNFVSKNESVDFDLIVISNKEIFPFYSKTFKKEEDTFELEITFQKDYPFEYVSEVIKNVYDFYKEKSNLSFNFKISNNNIYYSNVLDLNKEISAWNSNIHYSEDTNCLELKNSIPYIQNSSEQNTQFIEDIDEIPF